MTEKERKEILEIANSPEYASKPPSQIVPDLADKGFYIASESSFYRILKEEKQLAHRGKAKAPSKRRPKEMEANGPNQVWSWDITYLATTVKGLYFYLYLFMDVFSRKIVGWEVYECESAEYAAKVFRKAWLREGVAGKPLILHSDNGSPMKGATMIGMLQKLGVTRSLSRPSVSNDNAYSEALFKTMKYNRLFPDNHFDSLDEARKWVNAFQNWYNEEHRHSSIKFVTPGQRHRGEDILILEKRKDLYQAAKTQLPARWSRNCRNWQHIETVFLNPNKAGSNHCKNAA